MEPPPCSDSTQNETQRKLVIKVPEELMATLRTTCAEKANVSLLGRIQGKHPGLKALTTWARENLHPTFAFLSLKTNNLFEVTFTAPEGRLHALTQTKLTLETTVISFSSWRPHFDPKTQQVEDQLDYPVWVQVVDLCQMLREETFLRTIGEHMGQVIAIDSSDAYRAKLFGPRIRVLVRDLTTLPHSVVLPRIDRTGTVEYKLEYSGLPHQCGRCRSLDHQVRNCPRKEVKGGRRTPKPHTTGPTDLRDTVEIPHTQPEEREEQQLEPTPITLASKPIQQESEASVQPDTSLHPNEVNFPTLQSPAHNVPSTSKPRTWATDTTDHPPTFVWRAKTNSDSKGKEQEKPKGQGADSTPITRQGYRSGRLAEDFWTSLGMPNTPTSTRKKLRVIPFITKNEDIGEYLVDKSSLPFTSITEVTVAEQLAGIPWTALRAKQHVVNEVTQALHKVLVFNNNLTSPFQKWAQGRWVANWTVNPLGEHTCTLYVCIAVPETKVKIRKGKDFGWKSVPGVIREFLTNTNTEHIQEANLQGRHWQEMAGLKELTHYSPTQPSEVTSPNRFAVLSEEDILSS